MATRVSRSSIISRVKEQAYGYIRFGVAKTEIKKRGRLCEAVASTPAVYERSLNTEASSDIKRRKKSCLAPSVVDR